ncbi:MAG TPA: NAD(P)H-binding protein [bacterium]|jgi:uncharacterized protein YbjT (DUF2867 family)|nr:NAD(P)H-binding protein [bacterium]
MKKKAIVVGATGLIGGFCLQELLKNSQYSQVTALVRNPLNLKHPKLKQLVVDFDRLDKVAKQLKANDIFCCLGTTRHKSPTPEAYRKIEFEYAFKIARLTLQNKAEKFLTVSSVGADPGSSAFYLQTKGEVEEVLSALPFKAVHLFRPSFILGENDRKERRPSEAFLEMIFKPLAFLFVGPLHKYKPLMGKAIAQAMVKAANNKLKDVHVWEVPLIESLGA